MAGNEDKLKEDEINDSQFVQRNAQQSATRVVSTENRKTKPKTENTLDELIYHQTDGFVKGTLSKLVFNFTLLLPQKMKKKLMVYTKSTI